MSRRLDVLQAVKALAIAALPSATVEGLENDATVPSRPAPGGRVIVRSGDLGEPEVDLSPLAYNYEHRIPLELTPWRDTDRSQEEIIDDMMQKIGERVEADRTLGGLTFWLEAADPLTDDIFIENAAPGSRGDLVIIASYSTSNPLT